MSDILYPDGGTTYNHPIDWSSDLDEAYRLVAESKAMLAEERRRSLPSEDMLYTGIQMPDLLSDCVDWHVYLLDGLIWSVLPISLMMTLRLISLISPK